jgi:hypothetical protein
MCVNYFFYQLGTEHLFASITFYADPYTANLSLKSSQLLSYLYTQRDIKGNVLRRITLVRKLTLRPSSRPIFRVTPRAFRTLSMVFLPLLQHVSLQSTLYAFRWRMGFAELPERNPLLFPACLRELECVASQVDTTAVFPVLERLAIHRVREADGEWIARQVQRSNLKHLSISGVSAKEKIAMSHCFKVGGGCLQRLESFGLEYVHVDAWPLPSATRLKQLTLRFCSGTGLYEVCRQNSLDLETFTLVSEHDVHELCDFRLLLRSFRKLKTLVLLLAGRTANVPLQWVQYVRPTLETLILEARFLLITPALSYKFSIRELNGIASQMPNLKVLGLPIDMDRLEESAVCFSVCLLSLWFRLTSTF